MKANFKNFLKRQVSKLLAVVMAFSSVTSTGLSMGTVFASPDPEPEVIYGDALVNQLVDIAASGTRYAQYVNPSRVNGVDCSSYVRTALKEMFGTAVMHPVSDPSQNLDLDKNYHWQDQFGPYIGEKVYVTGKDPQTGKTRIMYFTVAAAGQRKDAEQLHYKIDDNNTPYAVYNGGGLADIYIGGYEYSSYLSYVQQFPGSIISFNGHVGVGIGRYENLQAVKDQYPGTAKQCSGTNDNGTIARFFTSLYNYGETLTGDGYYFGKTNHIAANSTYSGIRTSNASMAGKDTYSYSGSECVVFIADQQPKNCDVEIIKKDASTGKIITGAEYGIYSDANCSDESLVKTFATANPSYKTQLKRGTYYVKEIKAPQGYQLSVNTVTLNATGESVSLPLFDDATLAQLFVQKVDRNDRSVVLGNGDGCEITLKEYNATTGLYENVKDPTKDPTTNQNKVLTYSAIKNGFELTGSYVNNEGDIIDSGSLQATQTNKGWFEVVETDFPDGYVRIDGKDKVRHRFCIVDHLDTDGVTMLPADSTFLTGNLALTNTRLVSFVLDKVNSSGTKLTDAKFKLRYNDNDYYLVYSNGVYRLSADENGTTLLEGVPQGDSMLATLKETHAPSGGYVIPNVLSDNGDGVTVSMAPTQLSTTANVNDSKYRNLLNQYLYTVVNDLTVNIQPKEQTIEITKRERITIDGSTIPMSQYITEPAYFGIYTDEKCTIPAVDQNGNSLERVSTGTTGVWESGPMPSGVYFIREEEAPEGYGIQLSKWMVNINNDVNKKFTISSMDARQLVEFNLHKTDANTYKDVANAVYALYLESDNAKYSLNGKTLQSGLVGYYVTDRYGEIYAHTVHTNAFDVKDANGNVVYHCDAVTAKYQDGTTIEPEMFGDVARYRGLPNGIYYFEEVYSPEGYIKDDAKHYIDASWVNLGQENTANGSHFGARTYSGETVNYVVDAKGTTVAFDLDVKDARQTVEIKLIKSDLDDDTIKVANAQYSLINKTPITLLNGKTVPANTTLATGTTDSNGEIEFKMINVGAYSGQKLTNGQYTIQEIAPAPNYALDWSDGGHDPITVNANWNTNVNTVKVTAYDQDEVIKQSIEIFKTNGETKTPINDVTFQVFSVKDIETNGGSVSGLTRASMASMIVDGTAVPAVDSNGNTEWTTAKVNDKDGYILTGAFPYGKYVIWEKSANGYDLLDPIVVTLPTIKTVTDDADAVTHIAIEQPHYPLTLALENVSNETLIKVVKVDADSTSVKLDNAEFKIYTNEDVLLTKDGQGNPWVTQNGEFITNQAVTYGTYKIYETKAPSLYTTDTNTPIIFTYSPDSISATRGGENMEIEKTLVNGQIITTITVPNEKLKATINIAKFVNSNGTKENVDDVVLHLMKGNTLIENWNTSDANIVNTADGLTYYQISNLDPGEYKIVEIYAPDNYRKLTDAKTITVAATEEPQWFTVENELTELYIAKYELINGNKTQLDGVEFELYDLDTNNLIETWKSENAGVAKSDSTNFLEEGLLYHKFVGLHQGRQYLIREISNPDGYATPEETDTIITLDNSNGPQKVEIGNSKIKVAIAKVETVDGVMKDLHGVDLVLKDKDNNVIANWKSKTETTVRGIDGYENVTYYLIEGLTPGVYQLTETKTVDGYVMTSMEIEVKDKDTIQYFELENHKTEMNIAKYEDFNGIMSVYGVHLQVIDSDNKVVADWTTSPETETKIGDYSYHKIYGLVNEKTYTVKELSHPDGYVTPTADVVFTYNQDNPYLEIANERTQIAIAKYEVVNGVEKDLLNVDLVLKDDSGNVVAEWTTISESKIIEGLSYHIIYGLAPGHYHLTEANVPDGYAQASKDIVVEDKADLQTFKLENKKTTLYIAKYEVVNGVQTPLNGVMFTLTDKTTDETVATWTTDTNGTEKDGLYYYAISGLVWGRTYELKEISQPMGYVSPTQNINITISQVDTYLPVPNEKINVAIAKFETVDGEAQNLNGVTLQLRTDDTNDTLIEEWVSKDEALTNSETGLTYHLITAAVKPGNYKLVETKTVDGYLLSSRSIVVEDIATIQYFELENTKTELDIAKYEIINGVETPLSGVTFELIDTNNTIVATWTTGEEDLIIDGLYYHTIRGLVDGETYTLHEAARPDGYAKIIDKQFEFVASDEPMTIKVLNSKIKIAVAKFETVNGVAQDLYGVDLKLTDSNGNLIDSWTTSHEDTTKDNLSYYVIEGINPGTYHLIETSTLDGYVLTSKDIVVYDKTEMQYFELENHKTVLNIAKYELIDGNKYQLNNAHLQLVDTVTNSVVDYWTTGPDDTKSFEKNGLRYHKVVGLINGRTYKVQETQYPDGYASIEDYEITIDCNDSTQTEMYKEIQNQKIKIAIAKYEVVDGTNKTLPGVDLVLKDESGNVVANWTSANEDSLTHNGLAYHLIEGLNAGTYHLEETKTVDGYIISSREIEVEDKATVQYFELQNRKTVLNIAKYEVIDENKVPLNGVDFVLIDTTNDMPVAAWKTDDATVENDGNDLLYYTITGLVNGRTYKLHEVSRPDGYASVGDKLITVIVDPADPKPMFVEVENEKIQVAIAKYANVDGINYNLNGVQLQLVNENGDAVATWASKDEDLTRDGVAKFENLTYHLVEGLKPGTYKLIETETVDGYVLTSMEIKVNDTKEIQYFELENHKTVVNIAKYETINGVMTPLNDVEFELIDKATGDVILEWNTNDATIQRDEDGLMYYPIIGLTNGKTYQIRETSHPDGYVTETNVIGFTVNCNDTDKTEMFIQVPNTKINVAIAKYETIETGIQNLYDVDLVLKDADGNVVDSWTSSISGIEHDGLTYHLIEGLKPGTYQLTETKTVNGYATNSMEIVVNDEFGIQYFELENRKTVVDFTKYEFIDNVPTPVVGATIKIYNESGNLVTEWITSIEETVDKDNMPTHKLIGLKPGTYKVVEIPADGYLLKTCEDLVVKDLNAPQPYRLENEPITLTIYKTDAETGMNLPGAVLQLFDSANNLVEEWTTTSEPKVFDHIKAGVYRLHEKTAPAGYVNGVQDKTIVVDQTTNKVETLTNTRQLGLFKWVKVDANTHQPIAGVKFEVKFNGVPVAQNLISDENGIVAMIEPVPIATYDSQGLKDMLTYEIVEVATVDGQYEIMEPMFVQFNKDYFAAQDGAPITQILSDIENKAPIVSVTKTGKPDTFVGDYNARHDVTVMNDTDGVIVYTITIANKGTSPAYGIAIKDKLPDNTEFISAIKRGTSTTYNLIDNELRVVIDELAVGAEVLLDITVKIKDMSHACEIVNTAYYSIPAKIPATPYKPDFNELTWEATDSVVHQIVELHKTSNKDRPDNSNNDKNSAVTVSYKDEITYTIKFTSLDPVKNLVITDVVPDGLTYISGSAKIDGVASNGTTYNPDTRLLTFDKLTLATAGDHLFTFKVTVDYVPDGKTIDFDNVAHATCDDVTTPIESEHVTHKADAKLVVEKHGTPVTFEGARTDAHDLTVLNASNNRSVLYTITVKNNGKSALKNIVVSDKVPDGVSYVKDSIGSSDDSVKKYDADGKMVWIIPELEAGKEIKLTFRVNVEKQVAQIIDNVAEYAMVEELDINNPELPANLKETNHVIHQVVEFHKTSEKLGGNKALGEEPTLVSTGDTIVYTMSYVSKNKTTGVIVKDDVPEGLSYKSGTIEYKLPGANTWTKVEDNVGLKEADGKETIVFPSLDLEKGTTFFRFATTVDYVSLEKKMAEYDNIATVEYNVFTDDTAKIDSLISEEISHMTSVDLTGNKTTDVPTFEGDYSARDNVTVVKIGDTIGYTITVKNTGLSVLRNVVIKDTVPENTELVQEENPEYKYDEETKTLTWIIDEIDSDNSVDVTFKVKVKAEANKAAEIVNTAYYAVSENTDDVKDDEWIKTNDIVHQIVEFHKDSSIKHGTTKEDALKVNIGKTFSYILTYTCLDDTYNLVVTDQIPSGLEYVKGSAKIIIGEEEKSINATLNSKTNTLTFDTIGEVKSGTIKLKFDVKVLDFKQKYVDHFFINQANATVSVNENSHEVIELVSETISHKTIKTDLPDDPETPEEETPETPKDPVLGFNTSDPKMVWTVIAAISIIGMIAFGYIGFADHKKKTK